MRGEASGVWARFAKSFAFNNAEALIRIPIMALLVTNWHLSGVIATAVTLAAAFFVRFLFHSLVVYAPRRDGKPSRARELVEELDRQASRPVSCRTRCRTERSTGDQTRRSGRGRRRRGRRRSRTLSG